MAMKRILLLMLSFLGCLTAMDKPESYNGLVFLTIDNRTDKDWKIEFPGKEEAKIGDHTKILEPKALPIIPESRPSAVLREETGSFTIQFQDLPNRGFMSNALNFYIERFKSGTIDFQLAPRRAGPNKQQFTFDPAANSDAYVVKIILDGKDYLEKSTLDITQIKNAKFIQLLKEHGSNINGKEKGQYSPGGTPLITIFRRFSPEESFTTQELREIVNFLIKAGANINAQDNGGGTALVVISASNRKDLLGIARRLLEAGANPNIQAGDGNTPLLLALNSQNRDIAKLLINSSADVNIKNNKDDFALNMAIFRREPELAKLLIAKGAHVNNQSIQTGNTPLHNAVAEGYPEMVTLLIDAGANLTIRNKNDQTAIGLAQDLIEKGLDRKEIFDLLKKALAQRQERYVKRWKEGMRLQQP